jgi:hypothetical protein
VWFVIGRGLPWRLTIVAAAIWLPVAEGLHVLSGVTRPSSLYLLVGAIGAAGAITGRRSRLRTATSGRLIDRT